MRRLLFLLIGIIFLFACGKDKLQPPSEESKTALESFALAEKMRASYLKKDFDGFKDYCTEKGYEELKRGFGEFEKAELEFTPRFVEIDNEKTILNISWQGKWTLKDRAIEEKGMAVFELMGQPLKLNSILRGSPFKLPE